MRVAASHHALAIALVAALFSGANPSLAQAPSQSSGGGTEDRASPVGNAPETLQADSGSTGDIIVTARRRAERSQDVPVAINAFGGPQLEATRTYNLRDLQQLTPSLVVTNTNPRNTSINIRGLGNNVAVYNDGLEPAVGVYLDQVYLARPGQTVFDLVDLDRIEVLRGPQGTLFGKNTSAGAVVVTTKAPTFEPEAGGDVTFGNYDFRQVHAYASAPMIDGKLAARVSGSFTDRDGFVRNVLTNQNAQDYHDRSVRAQLLWTPTDSFKLRLIGDYGRQRALTAGNLYVGSIRNYTNGTPFTNTFADRLARLGVAPPPRDPSDRLIAVDGYQAYRMNQGGGAAIADWTLPFATVTSVTAYRFWNWYPHNDGDASALDAGRDFHQSNNQRQFSQELRLTSTGTNRIDYVAGLYYLYQQIKAEAVNAYGKDAAAFFLAPTTDRTVGAAALNNYTVVSHSSPVTRSYAAFAQGIWHVTPTVDFTGGLRYTYETKRGYFDQVGSGADLSVLSAVQQAAAQTIRARYGVTNFYTARTSAGRLSGQATLSWKIAPDVLTYATYARGNKFGGLNLANIVTTGPYAANPVIQPETIDSYEVGFKSAWFDRKVTLNLAAFWTDDKGFQTIVIDLDRNGVSFFQNAGKVRTRGFEGDFRAAPTRWLSLYASGTYDDARYVTYPSSPCPIEVTGQALCDLGGARLPGVSKWAGSAGGEVRTKTGIHAGHDLEGYLGGDFSYRSSYYTTANDSLYSKIRGYGLLNARIGVRAVDGLFDVQVWARNLTNKDYFQSLGIANTGAITGSLGEPRTYGVTLRTRL